MKKYLRIIAISVLSAIVFSLISVWIMSQPWSFVPYLILVGFLLSWTQKENKTYKFLDKLVIGAIIFGYLAMALIYLKLQLTADHHMFGSGFNIDYLWNQDSLMMAGAFAFISFLGGLLGIVLKGFYNLYRHKLDWIIILAGPLLVTASTLAVFKEKIGGTIMSVVHGWPRSFLTHRIRDIVDGFSMEKWIFSPGSWYHYIIFDYLVFLVLFLLVFYAVKFINTKLADRKFNTTFILFGLLMLLILVFTSLMSFKQSYISKQISQAGYCESNNDCMIVANRAPFSCAVVSNKDNAERIRDLIYSYPSTYDLQCLGRETAACIGQRCQVAIGNTSNESKWQMIKDAVADCEVISVSQTHSLDVTVQLKNGRVIEAVEPEIDDIFDVINQFRDKCGDIIMATE